jgi:Tol biopolymer transport system component
LAEAEKAQFARRWIAFLNTEETHTTGLYVTDPTGTTVRRLATAYNSRASGGDGLSWSPQSDRIAYSTNQAPGPAVRVVRLSDGGVTTIFDGTTLGGLSWSPDGTRVVGTMMPAGVVVMSASGGGGAVINQRASSARWSPRADEIAIGFAVVAPDGTPLREMGVQRALDWSPDGRRVLGPDLWGATVIAEGRCGTAILAADGWRTGYATWSPDGATIVVYSRRQ